MQKTVDALTKENIHYTGFLYGGLMYTKKGPYVIEFNARFGDPETEVILPRLKSDLVKIIFDIKDNKKPIIEWTNEYILGVVLASNGYPSSYKKGFLIKGLDTFDEVYHMGISQIDNKYFTNGGRVLFVYGKGDTLINARNSAYSNVKKIECENLVYRADIGFKSL